MRIHFLLSTIFYIIQDWDIEGRSFTILSAESIPFLPVQRKERKLSEANWERLSSCFFSKTRLLQEVEEEPGPAIILQGTRRFFKKSIHTYIFIYTCVCICLYTYIYIHVYVYVYIHIYTYMCMYMSIHTYIYIHVYVYVNTTTTFRDLFHMLTQGRLIGPLCFLS